MLTSLFYTIYFFIFELCFENRSLDTWEQEFAMFHQIRTIVFFRRYRLWKSFMVWMKSYRRRKMNVAAKEIQR